METTAEGLIRGEDGLDRCFWHGGLEDYRRYHDEEWGRPVTDDIRLFEKICLEGFQSGLSWLTILRKRENFRAAFAGFDFHQVARFGDEEIARCLADAGIIRHRGKIVSTINNARRAVDMQAEFGSLSRYFWSYEPDASERPPRMDYVTLKANPTSPTSIRLSKDLKKRGWTFVGPTTVYAFMQAMGLVNDHIEGCCCRAPTEELRSRLVRP
ncbi:DNA-3-methyladenine glycosylase I [Rhizobium rosettiformans]|uniref:DNA-3-methyladenine glycosylase I n=2 Tax=Rhizobium rosettiformans TaxID=1368430 RepID=A0A4V4HQJ7_9HYPH|nr:DNA-3-methyladenine glycosylase I [Rhizobium rosettiformans]MBB5274697.1 DNA-3-methyladenine glycosylase I [Rhizobium rosettiformans]THV34086.1 DNA-3-methyladenine glycosylase I [Rhizobium rosettiformans W3]